MGTMYMVVQSNQTGHGVDACDGAFEACTILMVFVRAAFSVWRSLWL
jgi:hypothetical protein